MDHLVHIASFEGDGLADVQSASSSLRHSVIARVCVHHPPWFIHPKVQLLLPASAVLQMLSSQFLEFVVLSTKPARSCCARRWA